jgi:serine/threonine-protein kinase/endoribonuclease IRE1
MGKGLEYLHDKKIIHGRLKPSMVCISLPDGTVSAKLKLAYFGRIGRLSKSWTAPEINRGSLFTFQMDIFSLGCVFGYILNHGSHIFGDNKEERIVRIQNCGPIVLAAEQLRNMALEMAILILDLIRSMVNRKTEERPSISVVLTHAFLTEAKKTNSVACQTESGNKSATKSM